MLFDGVAVISGSSTAATGGTFTTIAASATTLGYPMTAAFAGVGGFFAGGANQGFIPSTPATQLTVTPPATGLFVAQDEFFSIAQKMSVGLSANTKNILWDNLYTTNATGTTDAARFDNISAYGLASATGTVANNTALSAAGDPWLTSAATGASAPANWRIVTTEESTLGVSGLNAVNDFFVY
jgi:hypothetical protein